jgi:hypothetical protein
MAVTLPTQVNSFRFCSPECTRLHAEGVSREEYAEKARQEAVRQAQEAERERLRKMRCPRKDKMPWGTKEAADIVVRTMKANNRQTGDILHSYECRCGSWHVGNLSSPKRTLAE